MVCRSQPAPIGRFYLANMAWPASDGLNLAYGELSVSRRGARSAKKACLRAKLPPGQSASSGHSNMGICGALGGDTRESLRDCRHGHYGEQRWAKAGRTEWDGRYLSRKSAGRLGFVLFWSSELVCTFSTKSHEPWMPDCKALLLLGALLAQ